MKLNVNPIFKLIAQGEHQTPVKLPNRWLLLPIPTEAGCLLG